MMRDVPTLIVLVLLQLPSLESRAAVNAGYNESAASFVLIAQDPANGSTYYRNLNLNYLPFLQQPSGEINLAGDPAFLSFIGKPDIRFGITAFAPLREDQTNKGSWGVLISLNGSTAGVDTSWIGIDEIRQILQVFYSHLTEDSGLIAAGRPASFDSIEWSSTLLGRLPVETTGNPGVPLPFYFLSNPSGNPEAGTARKAGEWVLGLDGWLRFGNGSSVLQNRPPIAEAGKNQRALVGQTVVVSATHSFDPDESPAPLSYVWTQIAGEPVELMANCSEACRFTAGPPGTVTLRLTAFDGTAQAIDDIIVTSANLLATFPPTFRRDGAGNNPISFVVNGAAISPKSIAVLSYSIDGNRWIKIGQTPALNGRLFFKPRRNASTKQPDGAGFLRVCVKNDCDQAAITVISSMKP